MTNGFINSSNVHSHNVSSQPAGLNLHGRDPRWIGAWWVGFLIGGSILIICSIGILGYPRELPGSKEMRKKAIADGDLPKNDEKIRGKFSEIIPASLKLFKNPTYMFNTLGLCAGGLIGGGMSGFFTKILLTKFSMHPMYAGLTISAAFIPGTVGKREKELRNVNNMHMQSEVDRQKVHEGKKEGSKQRSSFNRIIREVHRQELNEGRKEGRID